MDDPALRLHPSDLLTADLALVRKLDPSTFGRWVMARETYARLARSAAALRLRLEHPDQPARIPPFRVELVVDPVVPPGMIVTRALDGRQRIIELVLQDASACEVNDVPPLPHDGSSPDSST